MSLKICLLVILAVLVLEVEESQAAIRYRVYSRLTAKNKKACDSDADCKHHSCCVKLEMGSRTQGKCKHRNAGFCGPTNATIPTVATNVTTGGVAPNVTSGPSPTVISAPTSTTSAPTSRPTSAPTTWPTSLPTSAPTSRPTSAPTSAARRTTKAPSKGWWNNKG